MAAALWRRGNFRRIGIGAGGARDGRLLHVRGDGGARAAGVERRAAANWLLFLISLGDAGGKSPY